ncbi:MAG: PorT family protein [Bacteroidetes bacterium]|nr:PorT family protein [Bacteroidota bacterium]
MKTTNVLIALLILFSTTVYGQESVKPFYFSFRMGPNISWLKSNSDNVHSDGAILGFSWGALCDVPIQDNLYGVSGFNIHFAGGKTSYLGTYNSNPANFKETYTIKYLELPVMLKIRTREVDKLSFYGQMGLGTAFRLNARVDRTIIPTAPSQSSIGVLSENINSDNITAFIRESLLIGVGAEYSLRDNLKVFGGLNFNNGFTDIIKKSPYNTSDPKMISNILEFNVGIYF